MVGFLILLGLGPGGWAQQIGFAVRAETGFFNRAYQDRQYVSTSPLTFAVPFTAVGGGFQSRDSEGNLWGLEAAQEYIGAGQVSNWGQTEVQPLTYLTYGTIFMGKSTEWWEADLGMGALISLKEFEATAYRLPDGSTMTTRSSGVDWNRYQSFALITGLARFFPVQGIHLKLCLGRQTTALTEELFRFSVNFPTALGLWASEISFSSPLAYWISGSGVLRSNERFYLKWSHNVGGLSAGVRLGFLIRPQVEGTGDVDLFHRLSIGIQLTTAGME